MTAFPQMSPKCNELYQRFDHTCGEMGKGGKVLFLIVINRIKKVKSISKTPKGAFPISPFPTRSQ